MRVDNLNSPDFLIVGAAKSGTTSLYFYLQQHPQIYMSKIKEPWFFSYWDKKPKFKYDLIVTKKDDYHSLFNRAKEGQIMGEASVSYLYAAEDTIRNIKKFYGENARKVKILLILRNPVDRAWSHHMMDIRDGLSRGDFEKCLDQKYIREMLDDGSNISLDYIGFGMYFQQVKQYLAAFDNVKIILHEDLKNKPDVTMQDVLAFLGVPALPINTKTMYNVSGVIKGGIMGWLAKHLFQNTKLKSTFNKMLTSKLKFIVRMKMGEKLLIRIEAGESLRNTLYEIYKEDIDQLERLIGRDLSAWKQPANSDNKLAYRSGIK